MLSSIFYFYDGRIENCAALHIFFILESWICEDFFPAFLYVVLQGILQSQGRILKKMRFIPSSLSSNSHRLLTALVDSRHKKVYKVKNCITDIDPEREKEEKERVIN